MRLLDIKKNIVVVFAMLAISLSSSCVPQTPPPPLGVWKSYNPNIILFLKPSYLMQQVSPISYLGVYVADSYEIKMFVHFGNGLRFRLTEASYLREDDIINNLGSFLVGTYRVVGDQIHYTLTPAFRERTGYDIIIFHQLENYDPINPEDWFPSTP